MGRFSELDDQAAIRLTREGGVAAMPGLVRPRDIRLGECSAAQRRRVASILDEAAADRSTRQQTGRGDQRFYRVSVWLSAEEIAGPGEPEPAHELKIPEDQASVRLVELWRDGLGER